MSIIRVEFFFDAISPYTFLAWRTLRAYRDIWRLRIDFRPVYLPALVKGSGNVTPLAIPAKRKWMLDDLERSARWYGLAKDGFQGIPSDFAQRTIDSGAVQRLLATVVHDETLSDSQKWRIIDSAFSAYWLNPKNRLDDGRWVPLSDETFLRRLCAGAGLSDERSTAIIAEAQRQDSGKEKLIRNTNAAIKRGYFGSPTMVFWADDLGRPSEETSVEIFGSDRFEQVAFLLNKKWFGPCPTLQAKEGMTSCKL
jgi:glutathione S-transferase kappa 1